MKEELLDETLIALQDALEAVAVLKITIMTLCRRPSHVHAERALLRLAIRHELDLGERPPLTEERRGLWRAWISHRSIRSRRERWSTVRRVFGDLTPAARHEVEQLDGVVDELRWAEEAHELGRTGT